MILRCLAGRPDAGRKADPGTERVLFALVANRALAASSKLAAAEWVCCDVHIDGLDETTDDACYRAMDQLLAIGPDLAEQAYYQVTDLLNLEETSFSSTPPAPASRPKRPTRRFPATSAGSASRPAARKRRAGPGSGPTGSRRTPGMISRRSS